MSDHTSYSVTHMEIPMPSITLRFGGADTQIKWNRGYNPLKHRITVESLQMMSLLDLSVKNLRKALTDNDYGAYVEALLAAEKAGKTRKGAVELLEDLING